MKLNNKIGIKNITNANRCYRIQFGNVQLVNYLKSIGIHSNKSKTLKNIDIEPSDYSDFIRGHFDGDGSISAIVDKRWGTKIVQISFYSASRKHLEWLQGVIFEVAGVTGSLITLKNHTTSRLRFGKGEGLELMKKIYYSDRAPALLRKRRQVKKIFDI